MTTFPDASVLFLGLDGEMPFLGQYDRFDFHMREHVDEDGIVAVGGNLSPGLLLSAYEQGIFPWYSRHEPIVWHSPDPRFVLYPDKLHVSSTMKKVIRQERFEIKVDASFPEVIEACAKQYRPGQGGTWITKDMRNAYCALHELGYAHCAEAWLGGKLVGGFYGVSLGRAFFGESMFHVEDNASRAAFIPFARRLRTLGFRLIDSQVHTDNLAQLGATEIPREDYLSDLILALTADDTLVGDWSPYFEGLGKADLEGMKQ